MEEMCGMPDKDLMTEVMNKHLGKTECFTHSDELAGFSPINYKIHFENENKDIPTQLMIMKCIEIEKPVMDDIARSQLWDCPNGKDILDSCKYQVIACDMLAASLSTKDRSNMLVEYIEALMEMFPTCKAVVFENSKKCIPAMQL